MFFQKTSLSNTVASSCCSLSLSTITGTMSTHFQQIVTFSRLVYFVPYMSVLQLILRVKRKRSSDVCFYESRHFQEKTFSVSNSAAYVKHKRTCHISKCYNLSNVQPVCMTRTIRLKIVEERQTIELFSCYDACALLWTTYCFLLYHSSKKQQSFEKEDNVGLSRQ